MKKKLKELKDNDICPCGSNKQYKRCCKNKKIKYFKNSNNEIIKEIPLNDETKSILKELEVRFETYYGRKPSKEDRIFAGVSNYRNSFNMEFMKFARECGIEEAKIYAFYMTGGIMPTEENKEVISDIDLENYNYYYDEFETLMENSDLNEMNILQYVLICNSILSDEIDKTDDFLTFVFNDFILRHTVDGSIDNYEIKNELDYLIFSVLKTVLTLESIKMFKEENIPEIIYSLARGLFENYLYLYNININKEFFVNKMFPKIDNKNFEFLKYQDGKINYNKVRSKITGEEKVLKLTIYELVQTLNEEEDKQIYDLFYKLASRHIHIDIVSAKRYFETYNPYDEINPSYIAIIILYSLSCMILAEIVKNKNVEKSFSKDANYLLKRISSKLVDSLLLIEQDKNHTNEMYDIFKKRLLKIPKNTFNKSK